MAKLFKEEQDVLDKLLQEWYGVMRHVTDDADGIFREKAKQYDKVAPVWERIHWPYGFLQELRKKTDRVKQLLDGAHVGTPWAEDVEEELIDIMNYARMFAAITRMVQARNDVGQVAEAFRGGSGNEGVGGSG